MVKFEIIGSNDWNKLIVTNDNFSPYQLFEWGEYKRRLGWDILRLKSNKDGKIGYLQMAYKVKSIFFFGWVVGSISGKIEAFDRSSLINFICKRFGSRFIYIKSSFTNILNFHESFTLYANGWKKATKKLNSDYTIVVDLRQSLEKILKKCSANWRKNRIRGEKLNQQYTIDYLMNYDIAQICNLFKRFKNIKNVNLPEMQEVKYIQDFLGRNIVVASSVIDNNLVGLRAYLFLGNKAIDFWAATDEIGRRNYTSYFLLFKLLEEAKKMNIDFYDLSGIDPVHNKNVFLFKNGLRAKIVEKLGEWELTNSKAVSFLINRFYL